MVVQLSRLISSSCACPLHAKMYSAPNTLTGLEIQKVRSK
ncbi:hypothetical protein SAMN06265222_111132 [Neorhodopirellula lusitana]|uniref:Uncharacterized protein n=1 Tax=Neorhodopirellula lusitana TaxID=445327 RepID=A0ABY1QE50_9BACT|nr:hypothetical protein SAMN06265222_111132 [Neorhodopirellula lusitana]